ncbi:MULTISPECIES: hypothetical protein [Streptomycetaceae]|uniref:ABC transporter related protein n=1 Tax=Streptantibioticus cattleyicolor (strain ATCC 35852 / DSM 46488 / JCM 4925 / NBRC 14057 / NRRL 8057) TaxID=1003195 RepID=F8JWR4_STREN|nr:MULTISPECIES: hypothetical protein [Streptomycetaceae]AEW97062.1 ABC transporter related protein [Streptantibioticus cattleyicolor NRRL 8057 = DSM 46488]MYS61526.1 ABC transporter [Streptomyces sp. SID5468]CCB77387.1 putative integral membrane protein [Streptantibioticus cattleyicolor NRRL 8057 = DSM 46488]
MTPLLRYQAALLLRSHRWLPPLLLYAFVLAIGVWSAQPVLGSLGWTAGAVLPAAAWLARVCVLAEPPAARAVTAAAAGPVRAQLARVLTGLGASLLIGTAGSLITTVISAPSDDAHRVRVPLGAAAAAGWLATLACVLLGTAVGVLSNPPVLRRPGWAVPVSALAAISLLVAAGSPANAAVSGLVTGSATGRVTLPWLPVLVAAAGCAAATALNCRLAPRR